MAQHRRTSFVTLTYNDQWLPPTLEKSHLQKWLKKLRKRMGPTRPIRFFACGEYGEKNGRPHYHPLIFGADPESQRDRAAMTESWQMGHVTILPIQAGAIEYVAGYTNKKTRYDRLAQEEQVDPETGKVYTWIPPFRQMSRRPGIGGEARKHTQSWRLFAIQNGQKMPVPRFLHESWKATATAEQQEQLNYEKHLIRKQIVRADNRSFKEILAANEKLAVAKQALKAEKRKY